VRLKITNFAVARGVGQITEVMPAATAIFCVLPAV
jgi:hypothetical protein